ncbi:hypothetical protein PAPYR_7705 [Paratrimastix pyriformis]|uniref:TRAF-type domain-containing protein n=1 Tax=Paratrimastix pyriformis TaxID=342808 RepID=A0ABQ8UET8_9EUKA|nr:hypothetical protein PAPYR_7705 [Paratrimastix pyriformis]
MWLRQQATCPCCREQVAKPHFHLDPYFNSLIQQLSVHCTQRPCEWQGKLEDLDRHQTQECSQREVACPLVGCPHRCPASALPAHLDGCEWKPEPCAKCHQVMPRKDLPVLPEAPLPCPVPGCGAQVARCRMERHISTAAPQHVICLGRLLVQGQADPTKAALGRSTAAQQRLQTDLEATKAALSETQRTLSRSSATQQRLQTDLDRITVSRPAPPSDTPCRAEAKIPSLLPAAAIPQTTPDAIMLADLRRSYLTLKSDAAYNRLVTGSGTFEFDLQAHVPVLLAGFGLPTGIWADLPGVAHRSPTARHHDPSTGGWIHLALEFPPVTNTRNLVPLRFVHPLALAAGQAVTFRCTNTSYSSAAVLPGNGHLVVPGWGSIWRAVAGPRAASWARFIITCK